MWHKNNHNIECIRIKFKIPLKYQYEVFQIYAVKWLCDPKRLNDSYFYMN